MNSRVVRLLITVALALPPPELVWASKRIFLLKISTPREIVKTGSDVQLFIDLSNSTNHEITFFSWNTYCDYTLEVRDSSGQSAPETEQKHKLDCAANPVAARFIFIRLKPGEHYQDLVFVTFLFDLSRPDKYTVQVAREIPKELGEGQVKSRRIGITVTN